jgi:butyryl-CoA dehydrogenase
LAAEHKMLASAKKLSLFAAGAASQKYGQGLAEQQEIMGALADCIMEVYALESCLLRAEKLLANKGASAARQAVAITQYYAVKSLQTVELAARKVIGAVAEGDMLRTQVAILRRLAKYEPADTVALGRQIARHVLAAGRYAL